MKPIQKFSVGAIQVAVWANEGKEGRTFNSVTMQKRYKTEEGIWKNSSSLNANDLPKAVLALNKAFEFISLKPSSGNNNSDFNTEFSPAEELEE